MATFFRHSAASGRGARRDSHSFISSVFDPGTGTNRTATWVDRALVSSAVSRRNVELESNIDPLLAESFLAEVRRGMAIRDVDVVRARASVRKAPLALSWKDYSLRQTESGFELGFGEPGGGGPCRFRLEPEVPGAALDLHPDPSDGPASMAYRAYPRLRLRGRVGSAPVSGRAWLDHQWGGTGWMALAAPRRRLLAWSWFGINLDDGSDWVLLVQRDAQTSDVRLSYAFRRDGRGGATESRDLALTPLREWESPRTAVRYPVEWRVDVPSLRTSLVVSALAPDQEIPLFGLQRALWQGVAGVRGRVAGRPVTGRARVELQGYGYVFDFRDVLRNLSARVDRRLEEFLPRRLTERDVRRYVGPPSRKFEPEAYNRMLAEPVWDMISRPGKRWRPIFALLLLDALGQDPAPYEGLVSTLAELCHTGSLIVDDIEDASLLRRGKPCLHLEFGPDVAINAANTLYFLPSLQIFDHPLLSPEQRLAIHEVMTRQYIRAHFGQALDLYWSRHLDAPNLRRWLEDSLDDKILQMYELKTAAPLEGLAEAAAIVARARPSLRLACRRCASAVGTAFQIMDDVHGCGPDGGRKVRGEDLAEGKMTYVLYRALGRLRAGDRRRLEAIVGSRELRRTVAGQEEALDLIRRSGAIDACRAEAEAMLDEGWRRVASGLKPSEPKIFLRTLCGKLMEL